MKLSKGMYRWTMDMICIYANFAQVSKRIFTLPSHGILETRVTMLALEIMFKMIGPRKTYTSGSGCPTYLNFLSPSLNFFFSQFRSLKRISEQNMYQNDHLKKKFEFLCIQTLVLK